MRYLTSAWTWLKRYWPWIGVAMGALALLAFANQSIWNLAALALAGLSGAAFMARWDRREVTDHHDCIEEALATGGVIKPTGPTSADDLLMRSSQSVFDGVPVRQSDLVEPGTVLIFSPRDEALIRETVGIVLGDFNEQLKRAVGQS